MVVACLRSTAVFSRPGSRKVTACLRSTAVGSGPGSRTACLRTAGMAPDGCF
jgi:hypothetical protein